MKIISCHIANFGKLHDEDFSFTSGLNEIKANNGRGKSTLAAFIKVMLYGLEGDGKKDELVSERKRYNPWQGGTFGGTMTFETAGKRYIISRTFGNKPALDTFELRDADTNLVSNDFSDKPGEDIFRINAESFGRTVFIGQDTDIFSKTTDDINAKLGNITDAMDLNRFALIDEKIKNELNSLSATRKTGEIYKLKDEVSELKAVLRAGEGTEAAAESVRARMEETRAEILSKQEIKAGLTSLKKAASRREKRLSDRNTYMILSDEYKAKEDSYREALNTLSYSGPGQYSDNFEVISAKTAELSKLRLSMAGVELSADERARLDEYNGRIVDPSGTLKASEAASHGLIAAGARQSELKSKESMLSDLEFEHDNTIQKGKKTGIFAGLGTCGLLLGAALILAYFLAFNETVLLISGGILVFVGIVFFVLFGARASVVRRDGDMLLSRIEKLKGEIDGINEEIEGAGRFASDTLTANGILYNENTAASDLKQLYSDCFDHLNLLKKQETFRLNDRTEECDRLVTVIKSLFADYGLKPEEGEFPTCLAVINRKIDACNTAYRLFNDALGRKADFENSHDLSELMADDDETEYTLEDVESMEASVDNKLKELKENLDIDRRQLEDFMERLESLEETADTLASKEASIKEKSELSSVLEDTRKYLTGAKESLTARYMGPLTEGFAKYYGLITGGPASDYMIDANTEITVFQDGLQHSALLLSSGYKDLVGLCMRLAMADAMYREEKPMLIMDDPFVNFDDSNFAGGRRLLDKAGEEYQILYFSCRGTGQNN